MRHKLVGADTPWRYPPGDHPQSDRVSGRG